MQPKLGKWAASKVAFSQLPPLLISSNTIFIEIDSHGKDIVINIPHACGLGNAVA